jgi:hypothetical protein
MKPKTKNQLTGAAVIGGAFILLALGGSIYTSRQMNRTAEDHGMSSGRPGDASPNLIQEQQVDKSARGPATTGATGSPTVPPTR